MKQPLLLALASLCMAGTALAAKAPVPELTGPTGCKIVNPAPREDESITWSGACQDGFAAGEGKLLWLQSGVTIASYDGAVLRGLPNGGGIRKYADGSVYMGKFADGKADGQGRYTAANGDNYVGSWKAGMRDGIGSQSYASGGRYDGNWKADQFDGAGRAVYTGGEVLQGEFKAGVGPGQRPPALADGEPEVFQLKSKARKRRPGVGAEPPIAINVGFSFDKPYEAMSAREQRAVRAAYPMLQDQDEPPYPRHGIESFTRKMHAPTANYEQPGFLRLTAQVDSTGKVTSVLVYAAPEQSMHALAAELLKQEPFKPGKCAGTPCEMTYVYEIPFNMTSYPGTAGGAPLISRDPRDALRTRTGL
jgi:hypothetical protein